MNPTEIPRGRLANFGRYLKFDFLSGFLVFLIALPLCLGISVASGFPPIAGIFTAIVGSIVATCISDSEMTIKGPAAGLIVIAIGCIEDFGGNGMTGGWDAADLNAYRAALAVGVAAAVLQIMFGFFRAGIVGEFFPSTVVHGMLAAIGVIIIAKQIPVALGVTGAGGEPLKMLREIPHYFAEANPAIAAIGVISLVIMFVWPLVGKRFPLLKKVPSPMIVLLVAIPMSMGFNLLQDSTYTLADHLYPLGSQYLVKMPDRPFGMFDDITLPDFAALRQWKAWKWATMFFIIGTLESLLSAKAIDLLDPWKRKTNMNRDILAVGVANLCSAGVGGLPMISEIVRSKANIDNGARTRFADLWHGIFLLACVALIPTILHRIPLAALAAMLVYTGFRLAHPTEFVNVWRTGKEQLAIFVVTLVTVLATDLLIGVAAGILLKMVIHVSNGVPLGSLFKPYLEVVQVDDHTSRIVAHESAVFSNWIPFRRQIEEVGLVQRRNLIIDVSDTHLVDHSVVEKLHELQNDFEEEGLGFEVHGLDSLEPFSNNPLAARRRGLTTMRKVSVTVAADLESELLARFIACGACGYTSFPCSGAGRNAVLSDREPRGNQVRLELIVTKVVSEAILEVIRTDYVNIHPILVYVESVEIIRSDDFSR